MSTPSPRTYRVGLGWPTPPATKCSPWGEGGVVVRQSTDPATRPGCYANVYQSGSARISQSSKASFVLVRGIVAWPSGQSIANASLGRDRTSMLAANYPSSPPGRQCGCGAPAHALGRSVSERVTEWDGTGTRKRNWYCLLGTRIVIVLLPKMRHIQTVDSGWYDRRAYE